MLKNKYQEILVGVGLLSLVRGIISLKKNKSTLLIDDKRFSVDCYPGVFLSELEVLSLLRLGKKYQIPELMDLRQFLVPAHLELVTEERRVKLGVSPLSNIKEMLRKYPELLDESDLDLVYAEQDEAFSRYFFSELSRFETQNFEMSSRPKGFKFDLNGPKWFKVFYERFSKFLNQNYEVSKNLKFSALLHLLSITHEEKLKTTIGAEEIPFYFFRTLSPIYRLEDFFLSTQLKRRLVLLGGDYKESPVQYWQFYENRFENLLLASFEGVISGEKVLFFSHLPVDVPFEVKSPYGCFRKTKICPVKKISAPFPPSHLSVMADTRLLGSERPYRVLAKGKQFAYYHWPFLEMPGSKPEFYEKDLKESFQMDLEFLPMNGGQVEVSSSGSLTLDLRPYKADIKNEGPVLRPLDLEIISREERPIKGFEYWGPFRYRGHGILAMTYGIEGN